MQVNDPELVRTVLAAPLVLDRVAERKLLEGAPPHELVNLRGDRVIGDVENAPVHLQAAKAAAAAPKTANSITSCSGRANSTVAGHHMFSGSSATA